MGGNLLVMLASVLMSSPSPDLREKADEIQTLVSAGEFAKAEPLVREGLKEAPEDLWFLSRLDVVLHGRDKDKEASEVRTQILDAWRRSYREAWIQKGSPVGEATWVRMMTSSRDYRVYGAEYFTPEVLGGDFPITSFYKVIALPKEGGEGGRVFKLEMSDLIEEFYVLRELLENGGGQQAVPYGPRKPDLRQLVKDAVQYLDRALPRDAARRDGSFLQ